MFLIVHYFHQISPRRIHTWRGILCLMCGRGSQSEMKREKWWVKLPRASSMSQLRQSQPTVWNRLEVAWWRNLHMSILKSVNWEKLFTSRPERERGSRILSLSALSSTELMAIPDLSHEQEVSFSISLSFGWEFTCLCFDLSWTWYFSFFSICWIKFACAFIRYHFWRHMQM